jgi:hypothetical protein
MVVIALCFQNFALFDFLTVGTYGVSYTTVSFAGAYAALTDTFVLHMAGVFSSYTYASLFIAMTDSPLLRCIFRQDTDLLDNFYIHAFLFEYVDVDADNEDIIYYDISCAGFRMSFIIYMVDTTTNSDTSTNLEFVRFIWQNYEQFNFGKYSLTFVRRDYPSLPELLCLNTTEHSLTDGETAYIAARVSENFRINYVI